MLLVILLFVVLRQTGHEFLILLSLLPNTEVITDSTTSISIKRDGLQLPPRYPLRGRNSVMSSQKLYV